MNIHVLIFMIANHPLNVPKSKPGGRNNGFHLFKVNVYAFRGSSFSLFIFCFPSQRGRGWSGGAMVLGKLTVPGRPTNLDYRNNLKYWDR